MPPQPCKQSRLPLPRQFMLPDPNHLPAAFAQRAIYAAIARLVAREFGEPERRPILRPRGMKRTPVPETSVNEVGSLASELIVRQ